MMNSITFISIDLWINNILDTGEIQIWDESLKYLYLVIETESVVLLRIKTLVGPHFF